MKVRGLHTVTNAIKKYGEKVEEGVRQEVYKQTAYIEQTAQSSKPTGNIQIDSKVENLTGIVQAGHYGDDKLAAYIEFGTGSHAAQLLPSYPQDVQKLAREYFVNGKGRMPSRPYLIPAYLQGRKNFLAGVKKVIKKSL